MNVAVILAAGRGTRLRRVVHEMPKGLLTIGGRSLVERSVACLIEAGIRDIVIVTGHLAGHYEDFASAYGGTVRTVHNLRFAESGSMYSLYCARNSVRPPFLLLESDLLFEQRAITTLLDEPAREAVLLSGSTSAGDEVFVSTVDGMLESMSKNPALLGGPVAGELVGISKISERLFDKMLSVSEQAFKKSLDFDYETGCLVAAARSLPVYCPLVDDLLWAEIDDEDHLRRAQELIYPAIVARESIA